MKWLLILFMALSSCAHISQTHPDQPAPKNAWVPAVVVMVVAVGIVWTVVIVDTIEPGDSTDARPRRR